MSVHTPDNNIASRIRKFSNLSTPSPEIQPNYKKVCTMSNPDITTQYELPPSEPHIRPQGYAHPQSPSILQPPFSSPPPPTYSFALQQSDLQTIVQQLRQTIHDEIQQSLSATIKQEVEKAVKSALQSYETKIDRLTVENVKLKDDIDSLEQYGRRELMRVSGIEEKGGENTTDIVKDIVKSIDDDYRDGDIIRSHRVGNPNRKDKNNRPLPPRQIIVRVRDPMTKKRILKSSKNLKSSDNYSQVLINEDLTKTIRLLAYKARQLKNRNLIKQTWTVDGKIFIKDKSDRISVTNTETALRSYVSERWPHAMNTVFPPTDVNRTEGGATAMNSWSTLGTPAALQ